MADRFNELMRYDELKKQLKYHSDRYYNMDDPEITDFEYDTMMQELRKLEKKHPDFITDDSPTQKVGGTARRTAGVLIQHRVPMLSMQDLFSKEDVDGFVNEMIRKLGPQTDFLVETKIDGLSMALRYENGSLVTAVTRGDGRIQGEDVTENARVIPDVRQTLKDPIEYLEIRGEVYMTNADFEAVNQRQELFGKKLFANPRNCAAGTLRQLDSSITKERGLSLFIFNIQDVRGRTFLTHEEGYAYLRSVGVKVIDTYYVCKTAEDVWDAIQKIGSLRGTLPYDIDGAVIKLNNLADRRKCQDTTKNAGYMVAYKYPPEEKETILRDIELSVGRTGRVTPTAVFDPILLSGTSVSRATLHNQDYMDELDIRIGDTITVYKSGEIIPKVKTVVKERRPEGTVPFRIPDTCPVCGAPVVREQDTADMKCTGINCSAQIERHIINFVSRDAMDIKGFGEAYIQELIKQGFVRDISDIYQLKESRERLIALGIIGKEKNTDKLLLAIEQSRKNEPQRLLTGLGIPNVGKAAAKEVVRHFRDIDSIAAASAEELMSVQDVGQVTAEAIYTFFHNEENIRILGTLKNLGVNMTLAETESVPEQKFAGLTFVITGTLPSLGRTEASVLIEKYGGKVSGSVSKKTDYLLSGEASGSKLTKAQELGVTVIDEAEFREMLGE